MCELVNTKGKISNIDKIMSIKIENNYKIVTRLYHIGNSTWLRIKDFVKYIVYSKVFSY